MKFPQPPAADETHVWIVSTELLEPRAEALRELAADDSPRALGRGFLRVLLGAYLREAPEKVEVRRRCPACGGPHGPPVADDLNISVSYAAGWVVYAVATGPVGIDIDVERPGIAWRHAARLILDAGEIERIERQSPTSRTAAFVRAWTRREAIGKATGVGVVDQPRAVDPPLMVEMLPCKPPCAAAVAYRPGRLHVRQPGTLH